MTQIRVLLNFRHQTSETADAQIERSKAIAANGLQEHGCLQYEVYRSVTNPNNIAVLELWESKKVYDEHWRRQKSPPKPFPGATSDFEFYPHETYVFDDGVWKPLNPEKRISAIMFA
jgi:quinol monooxygenase YgiN